MSYILIALLSLITFAQPIYAQDENQSSLPPLPYSYFVPQQLEPWVPWIRDRKPELRCGLIDAQRVCEWPGKMVLHVDHNGGTWRYVAVVDIPSWIQIPGSNVIPGLIQSVEVDGKAVSILQTSQANTSFVSVPAGLVALSGNFKWDETPKIVPIPPNTALISLSVDGKTISAPRVTAEGELWIDQQQDDLENSRDSLSFDIFRKVEDGFPVQLFTRLDLRVSGHIRDFDFGKIIPSEALPISIASELNYRYTPESGLLLQLRPGNYQVDIQSIISSSTLALTASSALTKDWPTAEVWTWMPDQNYRTVDIQGGTSVDPERTSLPSEWRGSKTFLVEPGEKLDFKEMRRGEVEQRPNLITVTREMWLKTDGTGYVTRDRLNGSIGSLWRMNADSELAVGRISVNGDERLITRDPTNSLLGVELRETNLQLTSDSTIPSQNNFLAVGWNQDVESLSISLKLPPGWALFAADGPDPATGSWCSGWTLLDLFLTILLGIATWKVVSPVAGSLTMVVETLLHHQDHAPHALWYALLVVLAILKYIPDGRLKVWCARLRILLFALLFLALARFSTYQIRNALFPQLGVGQSAQKDIPAEEVEQRGYGGDSGRAVASQMQIPQMLSKSEDSSYANIPEKSARKKLTVDPKSIVQTGPGLPTWDGTTYHLDWRGPVSQDTRVKLYLIPLLLERLLACLRVLFSFTLVFCLLRTRILSKLATSAAFFAIFACMPTHKVDAQEYPPTELLNELQSKLERTLCTKDCVTLRSLKIEINGVNIELKLEVSALSAAAARLPGPIDQLIIERVLVDDQETSALRREENFIAVRVPQGSHQLRVVGKLAHPDTVTLQFPQKPTVTQIVALDWSIDGLSEFGEISDSVQFTRVSKQEQEINQAQKPLPAWFVVTRELELGLPWTVITTVERKGDLSTPALIKIPLLQKESVVSDSVKIDNGIVTLQFPREVDTLSWESVVPETSSLLLQASDSNEYSEIWRVSAAPMFRFSWNGLRPLSTTSGTQARAEWKPFAKEKVELSIDRPQPASGEGLTIDSVEHDVQPGSRMISGAVSLSARASQGTTYTLFLPHEAALKKVDINGVETPTTNEGNKITLPISPGTQNIRITYEIKPWEKSRIIHAPEIKLEGKVANVSITLANPSDAWLMWAGGPLWGPAVLFWSKLLLLAILAIPLSRIPGVPLGWVSWFLLGLGLASSPLEAMAIPVVWILALWWRGRHPIRNRFLFNSGQILFLPLTCVALAILYGAIHSGLIVSPDMKVVGNGSTNTLLRWYSDYAEKSLPDCWIVTLPLWTWRVVMLLWSTWLAFALVAWLKWGFAQWKEQGMWRSRKKVSSE